MTNLLIWPLVDLWSGQSIFDPKLTLLFKFDQTWTFTLIFTSKTLFDIFTVISLNLVPDLNFGSTQFTRNPYARWFPINVANFKQLYLENRFTYETETSTKLKKLISSFYWCVRRWPLTFEIWHMTNLLYLTFSWPLTWSIDFRPQINPTFQVWPLLCSQNLPCIQMYSKWKYK